MDRTYEAYKAAQRIIDKVEEAGFDIYDPEGIIHAKNREFPANLYYNFGVTRLVIWDNEFDYVVKVALEPFYEKYNRHEYEVYREAIEAGIEENFAWCDCYIEPEEEEIGIYVMEFLEGNEEQVSDSAYEHGYKSFCEQKGYVSSNYDHSDEYDNYREDENDELMDLFMQVYYTHSKPCDFGSFLYDHDVNDLHTGNMLWRGDRLVICDYGGYNW